MLARPEVILVDFEADARVRIDGERRAEAESDARTVALAVIAFARSVNVFHVMLDVGEGKAGRAIHRQIAARVAQLAPDRAEMLDLGANLVRVVIRADRTDGVEVGQRDFAERADQEAAAELRIIARADAADEAAVALAEILEIVVPLVQVVMLVLEIGVAHLDADIRPGERRDVLRKSRRGNDARRRGEKEKLLHKTPNRLLCFSVRPVPIASDS